MVIKAIKKSIPIEAIQFVYSSAGIKELHEFCGEAMGPVSKKRNPDAIGEVMIMTLEDGKQLHVKHVAKEGDYIVKGPLGEFWPVDKKIFEETYEVL
jgi:hypothetical protein